MTQSWYAVAKGRVQGVGFRYTAVELANHLGLKGFVKNLPDGTVELCVQGPQDKIDSFFSILNRQFDLSEPFSPIEKDHPSFPSFEIQR